MAGAWHRGTDLTPRPPSPRGKGESYRTLAQEKGVREMAAIDARTHVTRLPSMVLAVIPLLVSACAQAGPAPTASSGGAAGAAGAAAQKPAVAKVLTIGDSYEPAGIIETFSPNRRTTGNNETPMLHDDFSYQPRV